MTFLIIYLFLLLTLGPMCFALCRVASDADRQAAEDFKRLLAEKQEGHDE
jgi:hypothetical protein